MQKVGYTSYGIRLERNYTLHMKISLERNTYTISHMIAMLRNIFERMIAMLRNIFERMIICKYIYIQ